MLAKIATPHLLLFKIETKNSATFVSLKERSQNKNKTKLFKIFF
jgi:hypothetical protein